MYSLAHKSNEELAEYLARAEARKDEEETCYAENEILARLDISLDESEQGLTPKAAEAIAAFVREHVPTDKLQGLTFS